MRYSCWTHGKQTPRGAKPVLLTQVHTTRKWQSWNSFQCRSPLIPVHPGTSVLPSLSPSFPMCIARLFLELLCGGHLKKIYLFIFGCFKSLWCKDISLVVALGLSCPYSMWDPSSPTRDQTCVTCIGRWILNLWTTWGHFKKYLIN